MSVEEVVGYQVEVDHDKGGVASCHFAPVADMVADPEPWPTPPVPVPTEDKGRRNLHSVAHGYHVTTGTWII